MTRRPQRPLALLLLLLLALVAPATASLPSLDELGRLVEQLVDTPEVSAEHPPPESRPPPDRAGLQAGFSLFTRPAVTSRFRLLTSEPRPISVDVWLENRIKALKPPGELQPPRHQLFRDRNAPGSGQARFYDPASGRFLTEDPVLGDVGTPPSLHRYLYGFGNPTVYVDPDGRFSLGIHAETSGESVDEARNRGYQHDKGFIHRRAFEAGVLVGSTEPDLTLFASAAYQLNRFADHYVPGRVIRRKKKEYKGAVSDWKYKQKRAILLKLAPEPVSDLIQTAEKAWYDGDSVPKVVDYLDSKFPKLRIKDKKIYRTHYGDLQWQHFMGTGTAHVVEEAVDGVGALATQYWDSTDNPYLAGLALGTALHVVQDSFSEGHTTRGPDGKIRKAHDFPPQSPHLHKEDDEVEASHPSRRAASKASLELVRLFEQHRGDEDALKEALRAGMFATDIDETLPPPNQPRATVEDVKRKGLDLMEGTGLMERGLDLIEKTREFIQRKWRD